MRKRIVLGMVAALLVGVAVTVWAQVAWVTVGVKFESTTQVPVLGNQSQWTYVWRHEADVRGIAYADCDAACRRQIVGDRMRELHASWIAQRVRDSKALEAQAQAAAIAAQLGGAIGE